MKIIDEPINRVLNFCREHKLLPESGSILCAVSGGADSMCMLRIFSQLSGILGLKPVCAHLNHMLRGEESDRDELFVKRSCEEMGIELECGSTDVKRLAVEMGAGFEEAARFARYEFLSAAAGKFGAARILTAHTADDNLETMLLNLVRGSGLRGICGIPPRRGDIIRPLLVLTRREVESFMAAAGLSFVTDSSNLTGDFARNKLRRDLMPLLREINAQAAKNALSASLLLRRDEGYLNSLALEFIEKNAGADWLSVDALTHMPEPVSSRVLRHMSGRSLTKSHIDALMEICSGQYPSAELSLPGLKVVREYDRLLFGAEKSAEIEKRSVSPGDFFRLHPAGPWIRCELSENAHYINTSLNIFCFQNDAICGTIYVRSMQPGDYVRFSKRNCTKKLKKLFAEKKIPKHKRPEIPVFSDEKGVIAVGGFGIAERCEPKKGGSYIIIEIRETA